MQKKAVTVLFSGGIDSTSCLRFFSDSGHVVRGVFVDFGQASAKPEREAVHKLQNQLGLPITTITATSGGTFGAGELVGRNAFLTFAAILLGGCRDGLLALGVHAGTSYYDCSPTFIDRLDVLVQEHTNGRLRVVAPFVHWTKDDVYSFFATLNLPLSLTRSLGMYSEVKREAGYLLASNAEIPAREFQRLAARYDMASDVGAGVPESDFLGLKRQHLVKVSISKFLDQHPGASVTLTKLKLLLRDNRSWPN